MKIISINKDTEGTYSYISFICRDLQKNYSHKEKKCIFITNLNIAKEPTFKLTIVLKTV